MSSTDTSRCDLSAAEFAPAEASGENTPVLRARAAPAALRSHEPKRPRTPSVLDKAIAAARDALIGLQSAQGYWLFELEADSTIPAEYVLMMHFLDEIDATLEQKIAVYLRSHQAEHGGWPLYHGGAFDLSCSVKAYFALKLAGDSPLSPHMIRARTAILEHGGAARANVFTRIALALFGQIPWRGVPYIPVEIMLLPRWFPFHLDKVSYWSRTVMVPLFKSRQLLDTEGDWQARRPGLAGGGWPFQFANGHYPDLDDTAVVAWSMDRAPDRERYSHSVNRTADWLVGMQSSNGGFAAFDVDNNNYYLNQIPFADHGALLDPPTSDVTARVVTVLARLRRPQDQQTLARAIDFLRSEQAADGSWFGRWGTNYIYGTGSVLVAFSQAGIDVLDSALRRAVVWLKAWQNEDGGWGESNDTYANKQPPGATPASTPYQTAWAVLGLIAAGEGGSVTVRRAVEYLVRTQQENGLWNDPTFTAPGFPRVFYLKYHGYSAYFPLWALAAYRNFARLVAQLAT